MMKVADFRRHAEECQKLARSAGFAEHRDKLLKMAQDWEKLAKERELQLAKEEGLQ
jgi:hypothetical protein